MASRGLTSPHPHPELNPCRSTDVAGAGFSLISCNVVAERFGAGAPRSDLSASAPPWPQVVELKTEAESGLKLQEDHHRITESATRSAPRTVPVWALQRFERPGPVCHAHVLRTFYLVAIADAMVFPVDEAL